MIFIVTFLVTFGLAMFLINRNLQKFKRAAEGREYRLTARTLFTDDEEVKRHYRDYVVNSLWHVAVLLFFVVLFLWWMSEQGWVQWQN